ncbi:MAG: hypothetical protein Q8R21_01655, partial [Burkholderiales bacterium]|nr:hypothetical protein [Burkholderiales bacterium]
MADNAFFPQRGIIRAQNAQTFINVRWCADKRCRENPFGAAWDDIDRDAEADISPRFIRRSAEWLAAVRLSALRQRIDLVEPHAFERAEEFGNG